MKFLTFGEIMLRLKPPYHERLFQGLMLEATFGGGEANVAVSLANYGMDVSYLTVLPKNAIGDACVQTIRKFGVDTSRIQRGAGRMGIYFLEPGANQLPARLCTTVNFLRLPSLNPAISIGTRHFQESTGSTSPVSRQQFQNQPCCFPFSH